MRENSYKISKNGARSFLKYRRKWKKLKMVICRATKQVVPYRENLKKVKWWTSENLAAMVITNKLRIKALISHREADNKAYTALQTKVKKFIRLKKRARNEQ